MVEKAIAVRNAAAASQNPERYREWDLAAAPTDSLPDKSFLVSGVVRGIAIWVLMDALLSFVLCAALQSRCWTA
jgi:hypothetical protein